MKILNIKHLLLCLWQHIEMRRRKQFSLLLLLMIIASFAEIVSIGAIMPFLGVLISPERVFEHDSAQFLVKVLGISRADQLLLPLTLLFMGAAFFSGLIRIALLWGQTRLGYSIGADLSISIYRRTLYQPYAVHIMRNSSEVIAGISTKANEVVNLVVLPVLYLLSSSLILISILVVLLLINPVIAVSAFIGFGGIYILIIGVTKRRLVDNSKRISCKQNQVIKSLQEGLGGIRDVLIDSAQEAYCAVYRNADIPLRRARAENQIIAGAPRFVIESLGMVLIAGLSYFMIIQGANIISLLPTVGALALGAQRLLPVLQQIYSSWTAVRSGQSSLSDALELLEQPVPEYENGILIDQILFRNKIVLDQISFRYLVSGNWVLRNVNLTIPKGSRIGFIGKTGSGKSTLIDIVMGLLVPTEGSLLVDGEVVSEMNCNSWRAHIAHVPQTIFLSDATICENIAFGVPVDQIDINRVKKAAKKAQVSEVIESLENKYNTFVGERGVRFSGGQQQRIGIARALYKEADIIVLDEATSALDDETEQSVMEEIYSLINDLTILVIAHRLTSLKGCDQIIEVDEGEILRVSSYEEIIFGESEFGD